MSCRNQCSISCGLACAIISAGVRPCHGPATNLARTCRARHTAVNQGPNDYVYVLAQQQMCTCHAARHGLEDKLGDEKFSTPTGRWEYREEVDAAIESWSLQHDKYEVMKISMPAACGATQDTAEILRIRI